MLKNSNLNSNQAKVLKCTGYNLLMIIVNRQKNVFILKPCEVLTTAAVTENIARASIGRKLRLNPSKVHNINYIGSTLGSERINAPI